jgi:hypothetical protein
MKQFNQKITATLSAILIALTLVGLNTDQAIAQGKARKGIKGRAPSNVHFGDWPLEDVSFAKGKARKGANGRAGSNVKIAKSSVWAKPSAATSELQNAENVKSSVRRKNTAGSEGFSIDIGTSENIRLQTERARRKTTKRK